LAIKALHFFAASTDIAEARSGTAINVAQMNASNPHMNFDLTNITFLRLLQRSAVASWAVPTGILGGMGEIGTAEKAMLRACSLVYSVSMQSGKQQTR
jgi:hypothetical protein